MRIFSRFFGIETVCFRYFNVFGPNPSSPYSGVLARFIQQMLHEERPTIFAHSGGNPEASGPATIAGPLALLARSSELILQCELEETRVVVG